MEGNVKNVHRLSRTISKDCLTGLRYVLSHALFRNISLIYTQQNIQGAITLIISVFFILKFVLAYVCNF